MRKIHKNRLFNLATCIFVSVALLMSTIAPVSAVALDNQTYQQLTISNVVPSGNIESIVKSGEEAITSSPEPVTANRNRLFDEYVGQKAQGSADFPSGKVVPNSDPPPTISLFSADMQYALELLKNHSCYSELSESDKEILCVAFEVNSSAMKELEANGMSLADSINYAQLEYVHGLPISNLLANYPTVKDCDRLRSELRKYSFFAEWQNEGFDTDKELKQYIFDGKSFQQVKKAYALNVNLGISIRSLLAKENLSLTSITAASLTTTERKNFETYAKENELNAQPLMEHAVQHDLTYDEMQEQVEEQLFVSPTEQEQTMAMAAVGPGTLQPGEKEAVPLNQIVAPYASGSTEDVNMSTGELTYQSVDVVIPGRNGLDLVIGHRYNSSEANLFNPEIFWQSTGINVTPGASSQPSDRMYCVIWEKSFSGTFGNVTTVVEDIDQGPFVRVFKASEIAAYEDFLIDMKYEERHPVAYPNFDGAGNTGVLSTRILDSGYFNVGYRVNNGKIQYFYRIYESLKKENTHLNSLYALGNGWSFMFSSIEIIDKTKVLHLSDGRTFEINNTFSSISSNLKDYTLTDLRIMQENGGYSGATYTLYYKDGKKEHFDNQGRLIAIRDRFNNTITLVHSVQNNLPRIVITDTLNNTITISGQAVSGGHIITVAMPDGSSLKYTVNKLSDFFGGAQKGYALAKFQNQLNIETPYSYNILKSQYNFIGKDKNNIPFTHGFSEDSENIICTGNETPTLYLKTITHPTGYKTQYTYNTKKAIHNLGATGLRTSYLPKSREDIISGSVKNSTLYYWDSNDYSGYPRYDDPTSLPGSYTYINSSMTNISIATAVTFNNKHLPVKQYDGVFTCHTIKLFEYNTDKLPIKVTTKTYNPFGNNIYDPYEDWGTEPIHRTSIEAYQYDNKGNVTASWSPLANGNTANTEYKTTYTYDPNYSLLQTEKYKQDVNTEILERNTVSGLNIIRQEILVNNVVKSKTEYDYNSYGNITTERRYKDGLSAYELTTYGYQNNAYLSEIKSTGITNSDGSSATGTPGQAAGTILSKSEYNNMGRLTKSIDANNQATSYTYNFLGHITKQTNPDNSTLEYDRNYTQNTLAVKDENGTRIRYNYNPFGQEYEVRDGLTNALLSSKTYDDLSRLQTETDALNGATTTYVYDDFSRITSKTTKNNSNITLAQESYVYNDVYENGSLLRIQKTVLGETNAPDIVTAQYIDNMERVVREGKLLGGTEYIDYYTYDYVGNKTQERLAYAVQKGLAYSAKWEYDFAGRVTKAYNADGGFTTSTYNALGQLTSATDYAGTVTTYTYDSKNRLLEEKGIIEQSGGTGYNTLKRYDYDPAGNITSTRIANNPVGSATTWARTDNAYNNRNRLEYVMLYDGAAIDNVTKYTYDGVGNTLTMRTGMSSKTSNDGQLTTYTYDRLSRILTLTDSLNQKETYSYKNSGLGLLDKKTDRNGNVSTYSYDALGRVLTLQVKTPENVTETNSYSYMLTGAKKTEANPTVSTSYIYDSLGRLTKETESGGLSAVKNYGYDIANNRTSYTSTVGTSSVHNTTYTYDNQNRLKTVSDKGSLKATYNYNANGARESLTYTNGNSEHYTYNKANWLTRMENRNGSTVVSSYNYAYFADGNQRTKTDHNNRVTTYAYDGTGRLKSENENTGFGVAYAYDRFGNRTQMSVSGPETYIVAYTYDANNRLTQDVKTAGDIVSTSKYAYDPNGNQLSKVSETLALAGAGSEQIGFDGSGLELYEYDGFNRMTRTLVNGEDVVYTYRADGLRHKTTRTGVMGSTESESETTFLWDGSNIAAELNGNTVTSRYVRGIGLILSDSSAGQKFYLYNGHGDVVQLAGANGAIVWQYDYDAFGNEREIAGQDSTLDSNPFRYCAEYFDSNTGTYYLRARVYQPSTGRFLTEDPIRSGWNWYAYCGNSPILYIDPLGLAFIPLRITAEGDGYTIGWNASTRTATVFGGWDGPVKFQDKTGDPGQKTYINERGIMMVWDETYYYCTMLTAADKDARVRVASVDGNWYKDISVTVKAALDKAEPDFKANYTTFTSFAAQVGDTGPWNLKRNAETWESTLGMSFPGYSTQMILHESLVTVENVGNITYGYLGRAAQFSTFELTGGSLANHLKNHGLSNLANEQEDQDMIKRGITWYKTGVFN